MAKKALRICTSSGYRDVLAFTSCLVANCSFDFVLAVSTFIPSVLIAQIPISMTFVKLYLVCYFPFLHCVYLQWLISSQGFHQTLRNLFSLPLSFHKSSDACVPKAAPAESQSRRRMLRKAPHEKGLMTRSCSAWLMNYCMKSLSSI